MRTAYLVGFIDITTSQFVGTGIFSEPSPTTSLTKFPFVIVTARGETLDKAEELLKQYADHPLYRWAFVALLPR